MVVVIVVVVVVVVVVVIVVWDAVECVCECTLHITRADSYLANSTHADLETWAYACSGNHPIPVLC